MSELSFILNRDQTKIIYVVPTVEYNKVTYTALEGISARRTMEQMNNKLRKITSYNGDFYGEFFNHLIGKKYLAEKKGEIKLTKRGRKQLKTLEGMLKNDNRCK